MYHERQSLQHCARHTLNNLLQRPAFTRADLDELCDKICARRTALIGNYDANVLGAALALHGMELAWHDARDAELSSFDLGAAPERLVGLVANTRAAGVMGALFGGRHWLALKRMGGQWWNLDSRLPAPRSFVEGPEDRADGGEARVRQFLRQQLADGSHVMAVWRQGGGEEQGQGGAGQPLLGGEGERGRRAQQLAGGGEQRPAAGRRSVEPEEQQQRPPR